MQSQFVHGFPYFGGGSPSLGKRAGLFYPPTVLLKTILPFVTRLYRIAVMNVFIAGIGVYWLMRDLVTSHTAAIFNAIAFIFLGSIIHLLKDALMINSYLALVENVIISPP